MIYIYLSLYFLIGVVFCILPIFSKAFSKEIDSRIAMFGYMLMSLIAWPTVFLVVLLGATSDCIWRHKK